MKKVLTLLALSTLTLFAQTFNVASTPELRTALETAATNGEDDTIVLADGTYKTTDDGAGTFIYFSNEANKLTLVGSSSENVILSGDNVAQILNHQSTENAPMTLEKLSFVDGNNTATSRPDGYGGGVYTDYSIEVIDCNFTNNSAYGYGGRGGGGFYAFATIVTNSTFTNNSADGGGGFSAGKPTIVTNSKFINNSAGGDGGGFYAFATIVTNSTFANNSAGRDGGGFYNSFNSTVTNSIFTNNSAGLDGGGFYAYSSLQYYATIVSNSTFTNNSVNEEGGGFYSKSFVTVSNSIFTNNSANIGGVLNSSAIKAFNILLASNSSGIYLLNGENNIIANSVFLDNNTSDINGRSSVIISNLENNYLDTSKVTVSNFKKNNIFDGVNLGFVDEENGDYNLTAPSGLIDAGTTAIEGLTLPATDLDENARVVGSSIDIGPYEFSTTKPTINSFTYTGAAKELNQLTFSVDYIFDGTRTLDNITYDYTNDGSWTADSTHTFDTAGTYVVNIKVTDSEGEFSTTSLTVTIAQITLADKLLTILSQSDIDSILPMITEDKNTAVSEATSTGITTGKESILKNLSEHNLTTTELAETLVSEATAAGYDDGFIAGKTYVQNNLTEFSLITLANMEQAIADINSTATAAGITTGKDMVMDNPSSYGFITSAELNASSSVTLATGIESGKQYVQDNLSEFNLITISDKNIAIAEVNSTGISLGKQIIIDNPSSYGLVTTADLNASSEQALQTGLLSGKEYVQNNLAEFSLVSVPTIEVTPSSIETLDTGWTLASTPFEITDLSVFDTVNLVWIFNNATASWSAYSSDADTMAAVNSSSSIDAITSIPAGAGVWVLK